MYTVYCSNTISFNKPTEIFFSIVPRFGLSRWRNNNTDRARHDLRVISRNVKEILTAHINMFLQQINFYNMKLIFFYTNNKNY
jgi:hypothetical protein